LQEVELPNNNGTIRFGLKASTATQQVSFVGWGFDIDEPCACDFASRCFHPNLKQQRERSLYIPSLYDIL
jgi:hypothetical protein